MSGPPDVSLTGMDELMLLRQIYDEDLAQAAWLIGCQRTQEAIVIDPERDIDRYLNLAEEHDLKITAVAETHIHADFLSGARELADLVGARVYVSGEGGDDWRSRWLTGFDHVELRNGDTFTIGGVEFKAWHTPGHTPEHMSYVIRDQGSGADQPIGVLSGDFVFVGDLGRPDLLESAAGMSGSMVPSARQLASSARMFLQLPDFLQVLPAHGAGSACGKALGAVPQSTVGYERRFNSQLGLAEEEETFVDSILSGQPAPPLYFARMKRQNRDGVPKLNRIVSPARKAPEELLDSTVQIVDLRSWDTFRAGHLPGALWTKAGAFFCASIGSYVLPEQEVVLICPEGQVERLQRALIRIGIDKVVGWCSDEDFEAFRQASEGDDSPLERTLEIDAEALKARIDRGVPTQFLDVRRGDEFDAGHFESALNIPHTRLMSGQDQIPTTDEQSGPLLVSCRSGVRSAAACSALQRDGYTVINLAGGWLAWQGSTPKTAGKHC